MVWMQSQSLFYQRVDQHFEVWSSLKHFHYDGFRINEVISIILNVCDGIIGFEKEPIKFHNLPDVTSVPLIMEKIIICR